jgi:hypothetical protein
MTDLRNLIDLIENLSAPITEGRGLAARKPGEQYANANGDVITFQSIEFYPARGQFATPEEMDQAIQALGLNIHWVNRRNASTLGFGIATFDIQGGQYYLGKYFKQISPNKTDNSFATDDIPGGFKLQSGLGKKESAGYKASEILTTFEDLSPVDIVRQITDHFGQDSDEANAARVFLASRSFPVTVPKGNMNLEAFRDYFCEMLQPIALVKGMNVQGDAGKAADIFFGKGANYQNCKIKFHQGVSGGLYDSLLTSPDGGRIKLSSKGKSGASASVSNLLTSVRELEVAPDGKKLVSDFKEEIEILQTIFERGHTDAPLDLAVKYGIINPVEAKQVKGLKQFAPTDDIIGSGVLTKRLEKFYTDRKARDMSKIIPIEHLLSAIAYRVADYVNANTQFGLAASKILNRSALVQMYTTAKEMGNNIVIESFNAVYPSDTVTGVLLDASKAYMSTQGKGNFTFEILKGGAKPAKKGKEDEAPAVDTVAVNQKISTIGQQHSIGADAITRPGKKAASGGIGRERR